MHALPPQFANVRWRSFESNILVEWMAAVFWDVVDTRHCMFRDADAVRGNLQRHVPLRECRQRLGILLQRGAMGAGALRATNGAPAARRLCRALGSSPSPPQGPPPEARPAASRPASDHRGPLLPVVISVRLPLNSETVLTPCPQLTAQGVAEQRTGRRSSRSVLQEAVN